jgi:hypothetical protein
MDGTGWKSRYRQGNFIFSGITRRTLGPAQTPIYWISGFLFGGKVAGAWS